MQAIIPMSIRIVLMMANNIYDTYYLFRDSSSWASRSICLGDCRAVKIPTYSPRGTLSQQSLPDCVPLLVGLRVVAGEL